MCIFSTKTSQQIGFLNAAVCSRQGSKKFQDFFWLEVLDICGDAETSLAQKCRAAPTLPKPSQNTQARVGSWFCCSQPPASHAKGQNLNFHLPEKPLFHAENVRVPQTPQYLVSLSA